MGRFTQKSAISTIALMALVLVPLIAPSKTFAAIDPNEVDVAMQGFGISAPYMTVAGQPTAPGAFGNGNVGQYAEGACVPVLMEVTNDSNPEETGNLSYRLVYDYQSNGQGSVIGIERFESIVTGLTDPGTADNLNDFTYLNADLSVATAFSNSDGGITTATITGPYSGNSPGVQPILPSDNERHYNITLSNVAPDVTVYVTACARLGRDAGSFPGASMHTSAGNGNGGGGGQVPIPANDLLILPTLNVTKQINGGTANATNWIFNVSPAINGVSNFTMAPGESTYTFTNVEPGVYTITEPSGPANYTFTGTSGDCSFSNGSASTTLIATDNGQTANCTLVNTFSQPAPQTGTITVNKVVVNDDGGTLLASSVPLFVNGQPVTNGVATTVNVGAYLVSETNPLGYTASFSGDCDANGNLNVGANQNLTCTITNDDQDGPPPSPGVLTIIKNIVEPDCSIEEPGCERAIADDFNISVYSSTTASTVVDGSEVGVNVDLNPGQYSVVEELSQNDPDLMADFVTTYSADCFGVMEDDGVRTCTVTNTRTTGTPIGVGFLTLTKVVVNDNGGTYDIPDFPLKLVDWNTSSTLDVTSGETVILTPGLYSFYEWGSPLYYGLFSGDCSEFNNTVPGGPFPADGRGFVVISAGDIKSCTLTNDDYPNAQAQIIVRKLVVNDNGGTKTPEDFTLFVSSTAGLQTFNGTSTSPNGDTNPLYAGTKLFVPAGTPFIVGEMADPGYTVTYEGDCSGTPNFGDGLYCTVTNNDVAIDDPCDQEVGCGSDEATIVIIKHVVNDNGGTAQASDFTLRLDTLSGSQFVVGSESGVSIGVDSTEYTVTETTTSSGYTVSYSADCSGVITTNQTKTCTVTNDDIGSTGGGSTTGTATIIIQTVVINNNGGWRTAADFQQSISASNASVSSFSGDTTGITITVDPGAYSIDEVDPALYTKSLAANCTGTISAGQTITCVITNDDFAQTGGGGTVGGGGGTSGGGSTGGSTPSTGGSTPTPPGQVLGETDEDPADPADPADPVTPPTTIPAAELPRTGLPISLLLGALLPLGLYVRRKA
jgi:hypothetical protein